MSILTRSMGANEARAKLLSDALPAAILARFLDPVVKGPTMQQSLGTVMKEFWKTENSANRHSHKTVQIDNDPLCIEIPRGRQDSIESLLPGKYERHFAVSTTRLLPCMHAA